MDSAPGNREVTCVRLGPADVSEKRNDCFHGRVERQQKQGSKSVDHEPWVHTYQTRDSAECCMVSCRAET
jgi:hypothetical protein